MFAGVLLAGAVVADPGLVGSFNPGSIASAAGNVLHIGGREGDEHEKDEHGGGQPAQINTQSTVDFQSPVQQGATDRDSREERERSRGPSSIVVNSEGHGSSHEHEEDDD